MNMTRQVLLALAAGLGVGLFFGEHVAFLQWPADAFLQLLQVTVLPYIVVSIIGGIARGTPEQARRLARYGGVALLLLWFLALALVVVSPLALPAAKGGSFFSTLQPVTERPIDWLALYIPSNPFRSLADNMVPAVVLFSVLLGVALIAVPGKDRLLGPLALADQALGRAGVMVVQLTPLGLFAISGHAAGTLRLDEFGRLQAFLLVYAGMSLLLTLWLIPGLVSALTGIRTRRLLSAAWDPLVTAFVTANLFMVLPTLIERGKALLTEAGLEHGDADESMNVLVPASFTFPHSAKLLSLIFLPFAGWFAGAPLAAHVYPALMGAGVLSFFGSLNAAVPFLLDLVRLPADLFHLFTISSVLNSRFGSAASAMHTLALALLGAFLMSGRLRVDRPRLVRYVLVSALVTGAFLVGTRVLLQATLPGPEQASAALDRLQLTGPWGRLARTTVTPPGARAQRPAPGLRLDEIQQRGVLRFGWSSDQMPWSFVNSRGEPLGFSLDMAHALALELGVKLEYVQVARDELVVALASGRIDIAAGRIEPDQALGILYSRPLVTERWSFLVRDHDRDRFASIGRMRAQRGLRIAVLRVPEWQERLHTLVPGARVVPVANIEAYLALPADSIDAMWTSFERGTAYSLLHPDYTAVLSQPDIGGIPFAFTLPHDEPGFMEYVNAWVEQEKASTLLEGKLQYWVYGNGVRPARGRRWCVLHDVLHW
ncbi:MAG: cation:dicarboxylase symporter family transporter [Candidatus Eisenbacteria bacterium]